MPIGCSFTVRPLTGLGDQWPYQGIAIGLFCSGRQCSWLQSHLRDERWPKWNCKQERKRARGSVSASLSPAVRLVMIIFIERN